MYKTKKYTLFHRLMKTKNKHSQDVSMEDIKMAIKKLDVLGTGFTLIGKHTNDLIVQSVPSELSMDHTAILEIAQKVCDVTHIKFYKYSFDIFTYNCVFGKISPC